MKAGRQFLRDLSRFAGVDARGSLQMALGVKGKGKKCKNDGQNYRSQPKMAHMREIHHLRANSRVGITSLCLVAIRNPRGLAERSATRNWTATQIRYG